MERLIRDLLDSSRLDFDGVRLDFSEVDLSALVARILDGMRYDLEEHAIGVRIEPLPTVSCDEWAMTRVLGNLVGNAIQYRHPDRASRIWVASRSEDDRYVITVRDNGIGIPEKDRPKLFQRFVRGSNTGGISGTGLGLHITREIMLGHGGDAWVESVEGEGTTFHLALPFEPVQPPHSAVSDMEGPEAPDDEEDVEAPCPVDAVSRVTAD
jgi:signal transduction histidine kinase